MHSIQVRKDSKGFSFVTIFLHTTSIFALDLRASLYMKSEVVLLCLAIAFAALIRIEAKRCPILYASSESETTGCYIVVLKEATTHEKFQEIVQRAVAMTDDAKVHGAVEKVIKAFTVKLSPSSLEVVSAYPCLYFFYFHALYMQSSMIPRSNIMTVHCACFLQLHTW